MMPDWQRLIESEKLFLHCERIGWTGYPKGKPVKESVESEAGVRGDATWRVLVGWMEDRGGWKEGEGDGEGEGIKAVGQDIEGVWREVDGVVEVGEEDVSGSVEQVVEEAIGAVKAETVEQEKPDDGVGSTGQDGKSVERGEDKGSPLVGRGRRRVGIRRARAM
jgi:hypothetical protein